MNETPHVSRIKRTIQQSIRRASRKPATRAMVDTTAQFTRVELLLSAEVAEELTKRARACGAASLQAYLQERLALQART